MEINKNLSEFVWKYASKHDFVSRAIVSGKYMDTFEVKRKRGEEKRAHQKALERKISSMFRVMRQLGIIENFSQRTVKVNRGVFNTFTLEYVLKCRLADFYKK